MTASAPRRAAMYACVLTADTAHDPHTLMLRLHEWCITNRHTLVAEYIDDNRDGARRRPERARLMHDAAHKKFDIVLVPSLDCFDAKGVGKTAVDILRLLRGDVDFHSLMEDHLCTDDPQAKKALLPIIMSFARLEEETVSKRIKAGMRRARAKGKRFGRKWIGMAQLKKLTTALQSGDTWLKVSRRTGIPYSTVKKYARQAGYQPPGWVPY